MSDISVSELSDQASTRGVNGALVAGALAGTTGLLLFLTLHALWIVPIWFILPVGLIVASAGGLAVGWAYSELLPGLPRAPWTALALTAIIVASLLPAILLAEIREPLFEVGPGGAELRVTPLMATATFLAELMFTAPLVAGLLGWVIGRTRRAAVSAAIAGFIFALGPGHNIPFIGSTNGVGKELAIVGAVIFVSTFVLVEGHRRLTALN